MTEKKFDKIINKIQTFMWLDNWNITYEFTKLEDKVNAQCYSILYSYFSSHIQFNNNLLKDDDDYIMHTIFHELSHMYTTQSLKVYEDEFTFIKWWIWDNAYVLIKDKMNILNEQQTELLARRFKEIYLQNK